MLDVDHQADDVNSLGSKEINLLTMFMLLVTLCLRFDENGRFN